MPISSTRAHGDLLDEQALVHALWFETIAGAGIAVAEETLERAADFRACKNAVLLPGFPEDAEAPPDHPAETMSDVPLAPGDNVIRLFEDKQQQAR